MEKVDKFNILEELNKSKNYEIALMTTFNFDISFFEKSILNLLYNNNINKISLFVDLKELERALSVINEAEIGKKYLVSPVNISGAFHPKIILLIGFNRAKVFISSANLTTSGYYTNNEIFNVFEYNEQHPECMKIIKDAVEFLKKLNEKSYYKDESVFEKIDTLLNLNRVVQNDELSLIHNLDKSILEQVKNTISNVKKIDIAVPYYDNQLEALKAIHDAYPEAEITLYLQNKKCKFAKEKIKDFDFIKRINVYETLIHKKSKAFYHGKIFRFKTENESFILYGSANCTKSALLKNDDGNIECDVLERGNLNEFDYFFENFEVKELELSCDLISNNIYKNNNYFYKYGIIEDESKIYLGFYNRRENLKIVFDENELNYKYIDENTIEVLIPNSCEENGLVNIIVKYEDTSENIICWFINKSVLEIYRSDNQKNELDNFNIEIDSEKYSEERMTVLRAMSLSFQDVQKEHEVINKIENRTLEFEEDEDNDEGIINYTIPSDEELKEYYKYHSIDKIRNKYFDRYLKYLKEDFEDDNEENALRENNTKDISEEREKHQSRITTEETKFRRFVKNKVAGTLNPKFIELVKTENYLGNILIFIDIFNKYTIRENIKEMFDYKYIIETKNALLKNLLNKNLDSLSENMIEIIKLLIVQNIIENNYLNNLLDKKEIKIRIEHKELLLKLNELFKIRESLDKYIMAAVKNVNKYKGNIANYTISSKVINDLFCYKTDEQLECLLKREYKENVEINFENEIFSIVTKTQNIASYMKLNESIIEEIINNCSNNNKILKYIQIEIKNLKEEYKESANPIEKIIFNIDLATYKKLKQTVKYIYKSGNEMIYKF